MLLLFIRHKGQVKYPTPKSGFTFLNHHEYKQVKKQNKHTNKQKQANSLILIPLNPQAEYHRMAITGAAPVTPSHVGPMAVPHDLQFPYWLHHSTKGPDLFSLDTSFP